MKLYYQLPYLTYDYNQARFVDCEWEEAIQLYKLIYKDLENFQRNFLQKLESISNLETLCIQLGKYFEQATPISIEHLRNLKDESVRYLADYYADESTQGNNNTTISFFDNFVSKLKNNLDDDLSEQYWIQPPASLSDLVQDKIPETISKIGMYTISTENEYVELTIRNIQKLKVNDKTKYLVCSNCNIESIELNQQLILLEVDRNQITSIEFNPYLEEANLLDNPLKYIKLNENLKLLHVSHPKNRNIEIDNSINNEKVEIYYTIN